MATQYYKVPESLEGRCVNNKGHFFELVKDELLTEKECTKLGINVKLLEPIKLSSKKTYWFFGARFAI